MEEGGGGGGAASHQGLVGPWTRPGFPYFELSEVSPMNVVTKCTEVAFSS